MKLGEYYALKGEEDEKRLLRDEPCFLFTPWQLRVAHDRWVKLGRRKFLTRKDHLEREKKILRLRVQFMQEEMRGLRPLKILWRNFISFWKDRF